MKQFKSLHYTFERLKSEVEMLTKKSIELNAEYNLINDKVTIKKGQLEELKQILKEKAHKNEVDITNFNKDYVQQIEQKDKELKELQYKLSLKEEELNKLYSTLQKTEIRLQWLEKELISLERQLNTKDKILNNIQTDLLQKTEEVKEQELKWSKKLKEKQKEFEWLEKNIKVLRNEAISTKQIYKHDLEVVEKQKMVLKIENVRLKEKALKIESEMKALQSAKEFINKK